MSNKRKKSRKSKGRAAKTRVHATSYSQRYTRSKGTNAEQKLVDGSMPQITPVAIKSMQIKASWNIDKYSEEGYGTEGRITELHLSKLDKNQSALHSAMRASAGESRKCDNVCVTKITKDGNGWDIKLVLLLGGHAKIFGDGYNLEGGSADPRFLNLDDSDEFGNLLFSDEIQALWYCFCREYREEGSRPTREIEEMARINLEWAVTFIILFRRALKAYILSSGRTSHSQPLGNFTWSESRASLDKLVDNINIAKVHFLAHKYFRACACCNGGPGMNILSPHMNAKALVMFTFIEDLDVESIVDKLKEWVREEVA